MSKTLPILAAIVGLLLFFKKKQEEAGAAVLQPKPRPGEEPTPLWTTLTDLDSLYQKHGRRQGVEPELLKAIAIVESDENPNAKNPFDPSIGLMQVLCQPDGQGGCRNKLNVLGWPPGSESELYDPDYNLHIASQILSWNQRTFGWLKGIAVYNSWSAREDPPNGPFSNQRYVDKVLKEYRALTGFVSVGGESVSV